MIFKLQVILKENGENFGGRNFGLKERDVLKTVLLINPDMAAMKSASDLKKDPSSAKNFVCIRCWAFRLASSPFLSYTSQKSLWAFSTLGNLKQTVY